MEGEGLQGELFLELEILSGFFRRKEVPDSVVEDRGGKQVSREFEETH